MEEFKERANPAVGLARDGEYWQAYKSIKTIEEDFGAYGLPDRFTKVQKALEDKPEVKNELRAYKQVMRARELLGSPVRSKSAIGRRKLASIIEDFPDTEAAAIAQATLQR